LSKRRFEKISLFSRTFFKIHTVVGGRGGPGGGEWGLNSTPQANFQKNYKSPKMGTPWQFFLKDLTPQAKI
jgi:hypothetical protein